MYIKEHDLKVNEFYVNPDYIANHKTLCVQSVEIKDTVQYINVNKRMLIFHINVLFNSTIDDKPVVNCDFSKHLEIELNIDEHKKPNPYFNLFHNGVVEMISSVKNFLLESIPLEMIEITPPLISGYEVEQVALSIYEKLIKPVS